MSTPASSTEPAGGASVCASGNQVCSGHAGSLTAKAAKKPSMSTKAVLAAICVPSSCVKSNGYTPVEREEDPGQPGHRPQDHQVEDADALGDPTPRGEHGEQAEREGEQQHDER